MRIGVLVMLMALHSAAAQRETIVVERSRVGSIAIGAEADSIVREFGDRARLVDLKLEGMLCPALELKRAVTQAGASVVAEIGPAGNRLIVTRIHVLDPALRTSEGIGVGSTFAELRSRYRVDWVRSGEGGFYARVDSLAMSFSLDTSGAPLWRIRQVTEVPSDVRVVSIMLTR